MSFTTFILVSVFVLSTFAQQGSNLGGIFNGLRYTFSIPAIGVGCPARPVLPVNVGGVANTGQLCFFIHEKVYIYATDCGDNIIDRYHWTGMNATLPGSFAGEAQSSYRYVSDGNFLGGLLYSYNGVYNNVNNVTNRFFAVTTNPEGTAITSFTYYYPGCRTVYNLLDGVAYKPYTAWSIKHSVYRTTNLTVGGGWCGVGNVGNVNTGVCINNCPGQNVNQGWINMPTVVCIEQDRWNSYKLTDCLGEDLVNLWFTAGGVPGNQGNVPNPNPGVLSNYFPYGNTNERGTWQLGLSWGGNSYNGYYLQAVGPCGATWKVPLAIARDAVSQPSVTPKTGLYRLHSNIPPSTYNNFHFGNGYNSGFAGSQAGWATSCNNARDALRTSWIPKNMQMCLVQTSSNHWDLTDCTTHRTKVIISFGWNGVSFTGWEAGRPIVVNFNNDGWMTGWTAIHNAGMCSYTFSVMSSSAYDAPYITNGKYARTFTPAWDFARGNRYYYWNNNVNNGFQDWTDGNCTEVPSQLGEICTYNHDGMVITSDCSGTPVNYYEWSGYIWETNAFSHSYGTERRAYEWIDTSSVTESSYVSHYIRGGCEWIVTNEIQTTIAGPVASWGHYTSSGSTTKEGSCLPSTYDDVGIYPSGLPFKEYAIQDWATGEIYVILRWDGSTYVGYDKWGQHIHAIHDAENKVFTGIFGYSDVCMWSISYDHVYDAPVLPRIQSFPAQHGWKFTDAYGVWNGILDGGSCAHEDPDVYWKYNTLICIWPNGPAVLNLIQCNDQRDDYQTILQQAWWKGGLSKWQGTDYKYSYEWGYLWNGDDNDEKTLDEITFVLEATGDDDCHFTLTLWRGDDCETSGWKAGISILSIFAAFLVLIVLYLFTAGGGGGGGGGGYHEYQ